MNSQQGKPAAAIVLCILILSAAAIFGKLVTLYAAAGWQPWVLGILAGLMLLYLGYEINTLLRWIRASDDTDTNSRPSQTASALVLLNEDATGIRSWDLQAQTGLVIGRGHDGADVDIDLSDTEYFSLISNYHAVLNYTIKGWMLADVGSRNGTSLLRAGAQQKMLLEPGEPLPILPGDMIYIAGETALAVK